MRRVLTIARSRSGRAALVAGVAVATVLGFATPAWAHHPVLQGSTTCSDGVHVVHWSTGTSETTEAMTRGQESTHWETGTPHCNPLYSDRLAEACLFLMNLDQARFETSLEDDAPPTGASPRSATSSVTWRSSA